MLQVGHRAGLLLIRSNTSQAECQHRVAVRRCRNSSSIGGLAARAGGRASSERSQRRRKARRLRAVQPGRTLLAGRHARVLHCPGVKSSCGCQLGPVLPLHCLTQRLHHLETPPRSLKSSCESTRPGRSPQPECRHLYRPIGWHPGCLCSRA